jgi:hypothetical protein
MVGAGISRQQLDELLQFAAADLAARGFWWSLTLTDPTSRAIDALIPLTSPGYTGAVYARNGWHYLGNTNGRHKLEGFVVDGQPVHIRQGAVTLTLSNVREHYPEARTIRALYGGVKSRWVYIFGDDLERAERVLLMRYRVQAVNAQTQPRLLARGLSMFSAACGI